MAQQLNGRRLYGRWPLTLCPPHSYFHSWVVMYARSLCLERPISSCYESIEARAVELVDAKQPIGQLWVRVVLDAPVYHTLQ